MFGGKEIGKTIVSLVLLLTLMLPSIIEHTHTCEGHDHHAEQLEKGTHVDQEMPECQICDFQVHSFDYPSIEYLDFSIQETPVTAVKSFIAVLHSRNTHSNAQLRAPPVLLT